jgi:site-specific recombinase XerD
MGFHSATQDFLRFCRFERRLSQHSIGAYECDLADFGKWLPRETKYEQITGEDLKIYLEHMVSTRELSAATVRRRLACLRSFYKRLAELRLASDPFTSWKPKLPRRKRLPRALARSESVTLFKSLTQPFSKSCDRQIQIAFRLLIATGLRVSELCGLRLADISPDCAAFRVHGKGSRDRVAYVVDPALREALKELVASRRASGMVNAPLFINRVGSSIKPQSIRTKLRKFAADAGLEKRVTPHMLRHTAATLLIENGVDIRFVQRLLGHSSIATTEIYTHVTDEALRATLERANILESLGA